MTYVNVLILLMVVCIVLLEWRFVYHSFKRTLTVYHIKQLMKNLEPYEMAIVALSTATMNGTLLHVKASDKVIEDTIKGLTEILKVRKSLANNLDQEVGNGC